MTLDEIYTFLGVCLRSENTSYDSYDETDWFSEARWFFEEDEDGVLAIKPDFMALSDAEQILFLRAVAPYYFRFSTEVSVVDNYHTSKSEIFRRYESLLKNREDKLKRKEKEDKVKAIIRKALPNYSTDPLKYSEDDVRTICYNCLLRDDNPSEVAIIDLVARWCNR